MRLLLVQKIEGHEYNSVIIVQLAGGLGNQMFQYALGRHLALRSRTSLKLDISNYRYYPERKFDLFNFAASYKIASMSDIARFKPFGKKARVISFPWRVLTPGRYRVVQERFYHFDPQVLCSGDNVYLEGYWQSYRYFADISEIIRGDFIPRSQLDEQNREIAGEIAAVNSVAVHVRRSDYVTEPWASNTLGVCDLEYYRSAVAQLQEMAEHLYFYLFSDDPDWVRENVHLDGSTKVVAHNGAERAWIDQYLMSQCRYHIIANSTFSWWGAWLSPHPEKVVIAPKQWFRTKDHNPQDIIPPGWLSL